MRHRSRFPSTPAQCLLLVGLALARPAPVAANPPDRATPALTERGSGGDAASRRLELHGPGAPPQRDAAQVDRLTARLWGPLRRCALRELKRDPSFRGLTVALAVTADGQIRLPQQPSLAAVSARLRGCLQSAARELRAPPAGGGELRLSLPLQVALPSR